MARSASTLPGARATDAQAFLMELVLTNVLVLVILGTEELR
jgi:glycerol uptake facilitator-like aquaporin